MLGAGVEAILLRSSQATYVNDETPCRRRMLLLDETSDPDFAAKALAEGVS
jgi:hypothetical protein